MTVSTKLFTTIFLLNLICAGWCQLNTFCSCNEWGSWGSIASRCMGKCDSATQLRNRNCNRPRSTSLFDRFRGSTCRVIINCTNLATCEGDWSGWSSVERCSNSCGTGTQTQSRTCYQRNVRNFFRNRFCANGNGIDEQTRNVPCTRLNGCSSPANTTIRSTATTKRTTTNAPYIATEILSTFNVQHTEIATTRNINQKTLTSQSSNVSFSETPENSSNISDSSINTTILAIVLGSVALFCVALIIIVVIVVKRKDSDKSHSSASSSSLSVGAVNNAGALKEVNYEVVGPGSLKHSDSFYNSLQMETIRYQPEFETAIRIPDEGSSKNVYLQPTPSLSAPPPSFHKLDEPTYLEIE